MILAMNATKLRLNQISSGEQVTVCGLEENDLTMDRLKAMGLCLGRQVEVVRQGNPLVMHLLGARIGLSGRLAKKILVERRPL